MPTSRKTRSGPQSAFEIGSDNVFRDIGVPRPKEALAKSQLVISISDAIKRRKLSQRAAAELVGLDQPKISRLLVGDTTGFSLDRLLVILTALGRDIEIVVSESRKPRGNVSVTAQRSECERSSGNVSRTGRRAN
jgi:predicted XRE-type DNA-binding protein